MTFLRDAAKRLQVSIAAMAILFVMAGPASAQWLNLPLPRTPDGKPNLSGIWHADGRYLDNLAGDGVEVPMHPWAAALYKQRMDTLGRDKPQLHCMPHGVPDAMLVSAIPFKI